MDNELKIIMRAEAKAKGLKAYYTGKACKYGHMVERQVRNATCVECVLEYGRAYSRRYRREGRRQAGPNYHAKTTAAARKYYAQNAEAERERKRKYAAANPEKYVTWAGTRRATKLKAIPIWAYIGSTDAERSTIRERHHAAIDSGQGGIIANWTTPGYREQLREWAIDRACCELLIGRPMAIDHKTSLHNGGEHCPQTNFQILTKTLNCKKNSKNAEDFPMPAPVFRRITWRTERGAPQGWPA